MAHPGSSSDAGGYITMITMPALPWEQAQTRDFRTGSARMKRKAEQGWSPNLNDALTCQGQHGSLNPTWVEWLMGFPEKWTDLKHSEMPSSRKSPK
jgi:hypothetical protein